MEQANHVSVTAGVFRWYGVATVVVCEVVLYRILVDGTASITAFVVGVVQESADGSMEIIIRFRGICGGGVELVQAFFAEK